MASPDRTPYDDDTPPAKGQGPGDDVGLQAADDDTGVSLPPPPSDPILPSDQRLL